MKTEVFKLPSGVEIEFRQITMREENYLSNTAKSRKKKQDKLLVNILTKCVEGITEVGPYGDFLEVGGKPNWDEMLRGDRFMSMLKLRCLSYKEGRKYDVDLRCPSCNSKFVREVDLIDDLIVQELPEESIEKVRTKTPFEVTIAGKVVKFHLPLGKTESMANKILRQNPGRDMAAAMRARIEDVAGVERRDILDWLDGGAKQDKFPGLTSDDAEEMRDAFDRVDGGVDTTLEAECESCNFVFEFDLPFDRVFLPSRGIAKRRRALRLGQELSED